MRDYGKVSPRFWTGATGKQLRALGPVELVIALYLITGPNANMLGLYYLPMPTLSHETGISVEGAWKALRRVMGTGFALYDEASEFVFVPSMARFQIGERLTRADNRHKAVTRELEALQSCCFYDAFLERYRVQFELQSLEKTVATASPSEAPSKPLRSQEQEQEQEQEQTPALPSVARSATKQPVAADLRKAIFDEGLALLVPQRKEPDARRLLGQLIAKHDETRVLAAIRSTSKSKPADVVAWLTQEIKPKSRKKNSNAKSVNYQEDLPT